MFKKIALSILFIVSLLRSTPVNIIQFLSERYDRHHVKTNYMLFSNCVRSNSLDEILLNNRSVQCVSSVRFLGYELDENLKCNKHINIISLKISKNSGVLRK